MLKPRNIITVVLMAFVAASIAYVVVQESTPRSPSSAVEATLRTDQVIATYFHGKARCTTCRRLEAYAEAALNTGFPHELADGRLAWRTVDISQPENRHFAADYQLQYQSLILAEMRDGRQKRWKNVDQIWQKVRDREEYIAYVQREVARFLAE